MGKLTDTKVSKSQKKDKAYKLSDGGGLFLFITTQAASFGAGSIATKAHRS